MNRKTPFVLALLFLAAAAAPPPGPATGQPADPSGLINPAFAAPPDANNRGDPLPANTQSSTLRDESSDVLHGLPMPDTLRPIDQPKRAPDFQ